MLGHPAAGVVGDLAGDAGGLSGVDCGVVDDVLEQPHILVRAAELPAVTMLRSSVTGSSNVAGVTCWQARRALST